MNRKPWRLLVILTLTIALPMTADDPAPTPPSEFLGYSIGARFTPHHKLIDYFRTLDQKSELLSLRQFGETYEGRPLMYAIITSKQNHERLDAIQRNVAELTQPERTPAARAEAIAADTPVIVWLAFGVHGNESSSSEAAMAVAHHLLTDPSAAAWLDRAVVVIDPVQNPDGRERYVSWYASAAGQRPNSDPDAIEHAEPWPGGRFNHYLFDMNRDWAWGTQRETRARVAAFREWYPQVVVDLHEMSTESSYFFPPTAKPVNVHVSKDTEKWFDVFGSSNADLFSRNAWPFFVKESFDFFYPGYADTWPTLQGSIGMTYEMAGGGRAGIDFRRSDESRLTLADRAERHSKTAINTVKTAVDHRPGLLLHQYRALRDAYDNARLTYLILPGSPHLAPIAEMLDRQGIEVGRLSRDSKIKATALDSSKIETKEFPAGTMVVTTRQRLSALVESLFEKTPVITKTFIDEQREKLDADEEDDFYDITAWSIPVANNLSAYATEVALDAIPVEQWPGSVTRELQPASFAWLLQPADPAYYAALGTFFAREIRFSVSSAVLNVRGIRYPAGTVVIRKHNNSQQLESILREVTARFHVELVPLDSGWSGGESTPLGSRSIQFVKDPRIALVGGDGTSPTSFGALWHLFDVDLAFPHSVIPLQRVGSTDLSHFRVLIFPEGSRYADRIGKPGMQKLSDWVRAGGTVIAIGSGASFLRDKDVGISKVESWKPPKAKEEDEPPEPDRYHEARLPGTAFRTRMNARSFLTFGLSRSPHVLIEGSEALVPVAKKIDNVVTIESKDAVMSGFAWPESLGRFEGSAWLIAEKHGSGNVITFATDPVFRLFWRGTTPLLMNAAIYSPSFLDR